MHVSFLIALPLNAQQAYQGVSAIYPSGSASISMDGLMAAYDFETYTDDGLLKDFSSYNNHGKFNTNYSTQGNVGKARRFSKHEDIIVLPDNSSLNLTGPITFASKLKITKAGLHQHIFACSGMFVLWLTEDNQYRFADTRGQGFLTNTGISAVKDGNWHSVIAVLSAGKGLELNENNIRIFIDGKQVKGSFTKTWQPTKLPAKNACVIGGELNGREQHQKLQFEGVIDEMQIFARAFTDDEIRIYSSK